MLSLKGECWSMADVHDQKTRSYNMSRIRSVGTKPEEKVRKYLFSKGFRYRKNDKRFPGKPDIVMPKYKTIIFINGCFWHRHNCKYFVWPKTNVEFWKKKIEGNVLRDYNNYLILEEQGWNVLIVWECELKKDVFENTMRQLTESILLYSKKERLKDEF